MKENIRDEEYNHEDVKEANKTIVEEIKQRMKAVVNKRYKILVQCIIGEKKGQGLKIGSKCLWDKSADSAIWESYENKFVYAFVVAYGVYFY